MSDHQCYLCGAQNDPSASFCSRCNGQLLSLGNEPEPEAAPEPEVPEVEEKKGPDNFSRLRQLRRKSTLDDSRLSDALGLSDPLGSQGTSSATDCPRQRSPPSRRPRPRRTSPSSEPYPAVQVEIYEVRHQGLASLFSSDSSFSQRPGWHGSLLDRHPRLNQRTLHSQLRPPPPRSLRRLPPRPRSANGPNSKLILSSAIPW